MAGILFSFINLRLLHHEIKFFTEKFIADNITAEILSEYEFLIFHTLIYTVVLSVFLIFVSLFTDDKKSKKNKNKMGNQYFPINPVNVNFYYLTNGQYAMNYAANHPRNINYINDPNLDEGSMHQYYPGISSFNPSNANLNENNFRPILIPADQTQVNPFDLDQLDGFNPEKNRKFAVPMNTYMFNNKNATDHLTFMNCSDLVSKMGDSSIRSTNSYGW